MADFHDFGKAVNAQYERMAKGELFVVDTTDIFESYLASFPEGTNPIFRERTEHDCNCCKQFVRRLGNVISIDKDGNRHTVWDGFGGFEEPYATVACAMYNLVRQAPIRGVFRTKEAQYGTEYNYDTQTDRRWNHFVGRVSPKHLSANPETLRGEKDAAHQVLRRGLDELKPEAIDTVLDLIESKSVYRGEEHQAAVKSFRDIQQRYLKAKDPDTFVWSNLDAPAARMRNSAIGTLVQDISDGVDLEAAVKKFEAKVAPANYKRPKAIITAKMVAQAEETLQELGLETALERRYAVIGDVSVNNVLWVSNSAKPKLKGGLSSLLADDVQQPKVEVKGAEEISMDDFLAKILPQTTELEMLVENRHMGNFVSLTAPVHADAGRLFKWGNNFAWSYDGEVTDSMRQRVTEAGGRVDGVLRFTHQWNHVGRNASLMDLHVFMPGSSAHSSGSHDRYPDGQRVGWNRRSDSISGGRQDVDYTDAAPANYVPIENITFPSLDKLKNGKYVFKIHNWHLRQPTNSGFKAEIEFGGQIFQYDHPQPLKNKEWVTLAEVTLKDGIFTIEHKHETTTSSRKKWGISTMTLVPVETLMLSPNHWDGENPGGNRHWFFMLKEARNPEGTRGIYNEFLRPEFEKHRKVFEILGSRTKCPPSDAQLSGLGFSSTRKDEVTVVAKGPKLNKAYNIKF